LGHVRYRDDGPTAFGKQGCFEAWCAGNSLPRLAAWRFPNRWAQQPPDGQAIAALAAAGDEDARSVLEASAKGVGDACALLGDLLGPEVILLGSLARYFGMEWLQQVRSRFGRQVLPSVAAGCRIEPAALGGRLQDLSALVVAIAGTEQTS
jgi:glucokinase